MPLTSELPIQSTRMYLRLYQGLSVVFSPNVGLLAGGGAVIAQDVKLRDDWVHADRIAGGDPQ
jgi:hypothetical protein